MRFTCMLVVLVVWSACSGSAAQVDAALGDDTPDGEVADAAMIDAAMIDARPPDAGVVPDAAPPDAPPPPPACDCDTGTGCQSDCACDPACGPLHCAPLLPSMAYFANRGGSVKGVSLADPDNGWAVGFAGMILRLTATSAAPVPSPTTRILWDVEIVDIDTGWAVGDQIILRLENGIWRVWTDYAPLGALYQLDIVDDANGLAVGPDGLVARLRDGVWSTIDLGTTAYMWGVALADRDNGWIFTGGSDGARIELSDGVWSSSPQVPGKAIYAAALVDLDRGWGVGQGNGPIWKLENGSWVDTEIVLATFTSTAVALRDFANGWAISYSGEAMKLVNDVWSAQTCQCGYVTDMDVKGNRGWAVGGQYTMNSIPPKLVPFDTSATTWNALTFTGGTTKALVTAAVTGESEGWAAGEGGVLLRLTPTGWTTLPAIGTTETFRGMALSSATSGWAVGGGGKIARLNSGTWSLATSPTTASLYGVVLAADSTGWAVGGSTAMQPGIFLRFNGTSWSVDPFVPSAEVHAVALTDAANGWAVGGDAADTSGVIWRLENGTWSQVMITPDAPLWAIALDPAGNGWAVGGTIDFGTGSVPVVWRLEGGSWTQVPFTGDTMLHGVAVGADGLGWIVGTKQTVIAIDGAGINACPDAMGWPVDLSTVVLTPAGRAWVVGTEGMRARTP